MASTSSSATTKSGSNLRSAPNLLSRLRADFPNINFIPGEQFMYSPPNTVIFTPDEPEFDLLILHELSHALLGHKDYNQDILLIQLETLAWHHAHKLAQDYHVRWHQDRAESRLDTYRDWLAKRSACPRCNMAGYQTPDRIYHCPHCLTRWRARINRIRL